MTQQVINNQKIHQTSTRLLFTKCGRCFSWLIFSSPTLLVSSLSNHGEPWFFAAKIKARHPWRMLVSWRRLGSDGRSCFKVKPTTWTASCRKLGFNGHPKWNPKPSPNVRVLLTSTKGPRKKLTVWRGESWSIQLGKFISESFWQWLHYLKQWAYLAHSNAPRYGSLWIYTCSNIASPQYTQKHYIMSWLSKTRNGSKAGRISQISACTLISQNIYLAQDFKTGPEIFWLETGKSQDAACLPTSHSKQSSGIHGSTCWSSQNLDVQCPVIQSRSGGSGWKGEIHHGNEAQNSKEEKHRDI